MKRIDALSVAGKPALINVGPTPDELHIGEDRAVALATADENFVVELLLTPYQARCVAHQLLTAAAAR